METWVIAGIAFGCGIIITSLLFFAIETYLDYDTYLDYSTGYNRGYSKGVLDGYDLYQKFCNKEKVGENDG